MLLSEWCRGVPHESWNKITIASHVLCAGAVWLAARYWLIAHRFIPVSFNDTITIIPHLWFLFISEWSNPIEKPSHSCNFVIVSSRNVFAIPCFDKYSAFVLLSLIFETILLPSSPLKWVLIQSTRQFIIVVGALWLSNLLVKSISNLLAFFFTFCSKASPSNASLILNCFFFEFHLFMFSMCFFALLCYIKASFPFLKQNNFPRQALHLGRLHQHQLPTYQFCLCHQVTPHNSLPPCYYPCIFF